MPGKDASASGEAVVDVAVAVLERPDGSVLLARRPTGKVYAGYWEFPGGKVEPGESVRNALQREIREELCIEVSRASPWITRVFTYPHATVRLHFFRIRAWRGEPLAIEHEGLAWQPPNAVTVEPMLPANGPVLSALALPVEYAISQAGVLGEERFLERLRRRLNDGLRLIQLREPELPVEQFVHLSDRVVRIAQGAGAKVLINSDFDLARRIGADGVHVTARQLAVLRQRPDFPLVGVSCHGAAELRAAERLRADFAVLGPVMPTPTHPGAATLGWDGFERAARGCAIPVYALGGLVREDLEAGWARGAHGIAMVRGAWKA